MSKGITAAEIARLYETSTKATPGDWAVDEGGQVVSTQKHGGRNKKVQVTESTLRKGGGVKEPEDAAFIALASPERVKRLVEYVWELEGKLEG